MSITKSNLQLQHGFRFGEMNIIFKFKNLIKFIHILSDKTCAYGSYFIYAKQRPTQPLDI